MSRVPIVSHYDPNPGTQAIERAVRLADDLLKEQPGIRPGELVRQSTPKRLRDGPTLHLDDLSTIPLLERFYDVTFTQDRARLRADSGDFVAVCEGHVPEFEEYCATRLELGSVEWLSAQTERSPLAVASACWTDREVRQTLQHKLLSGNLRYLHPHMGTFPVWALATLLRRATDRPIEVIAPPPTLTQRTNDKVWFTDVVGRLFGEHATPPAAEAWNYTTLARLVQNFSRRAGKLVIKVPDSAGGAGNLVLRSEEFLGLPIGQIRSRLKKRMHHFGWQGEQHLLVGCWESDVLCAPSAQIWIPPPGDGPPVVEGVFAQMIGGEEGYFLGSRPADLPEPIEREMVERSWLLTYLFQRLGYIGRCSFDCLLVGTEPENSRVEFIECNGRWGGTSGPMTLMNRLFGDWSRHPYATRGVTIPGLDRLSFGELACALRERLYDAKSGNGDLILYNPRGLEARPGIDVIALGDDRTQAEETIGTELPELLEGLVASRGGPPPPSTSPLGQAHTYHFSS